VDLDLVWLEEVSIEGGVGVGTNLEFDSGCSVVEEPISEVWHDSLAWSLVTIYIKPTGDYGGTYVKYKKRKSTRRIKNRYINAGIGSEL